MKKKLQELEWLDSQQSEMLTLVEALCNLNSGTFNLPGLECVTTRLIAEYSCLEGVVERLPTEPFQEIDDHGETTTKPLGSMIHIRKWPKASSRVLLCIHMDTVYAVDHPFQKCKLQPDGTLNGPGVADAKGGLVVMLYALRMLERSSLAGKIGWDVLINPDEEIGSPGSSATIARLATGFDFGLLFEPCLPDGTLVSWRKGSGNFTFVVRGRSAHAGRDFSQGRNAIAALARLLAAIDDLNSDPEVTFNIGKVTGGGPLNVVPDRSIGRINVRVRTVAQQIEVVELLNQLVSRFNQLDGISVTRFGGFSSPPKPLDSGVLALQKRIEACGDLLGLPIQWQGTGGACDGNKFAAAGLANIDTLGPCGGNIHSESEFLIPSSLVSRAKLAALVMMNFADDGGSR